MYRLVLCAAVLIVSTALCFNARAQSAVPGKLVTNTVSGRVTTHGKPAPGIVVAVRANEYGPSTTPGYRATTDQEGNYRITKVPPGNYQVSLMAPVYVAEDSANRLRSKSLILGEGEDVTGIDFSIVRGGVITGKLTDTSGRPVIEERIVVLLESQTRERGGPPVTNYSFQTDDRGIYRMYGIPAGRYRVAAGQGNEDGYFYPRPGRPTYRRTFYPGTPNIEEAKIVEVTEGGESQNVDITLETSVPGFTVSGVVVNGDNGQPIPGLRFGVRRMEPNNYGIIGNSSISNGRGEFRIDNVPVGKYSVMIMPQIGNEVVADPVPFEVIDQDVTGLTVQTSRGTSVSGIVVVEGSNDKTIPAKLAQLRLAVFVRDENGGPASGMFSLLGPDGSFRIGGLSAGIANFNISQQDRRPSGFNIVRVEKDGVAQARGLEVKAGENVTGVRVVLSYGNSSIRGEVKVENGSLPAGATMFVSVKKADDPQAGSRPYGVDARGHFLIEGITAGTYELSVTSNRMSRQSPQPKQVVTVTDGAVTDVQLVLDLQGTPEP